MMNKFLYLIAFIVVCEMAGIIGSVFTTDSVREWYPALVKPEFNPPSWVFGPVWTTLYLLMGISAFLVFVSGKEESNRALMVFGGQLVLNTLWSIAFFGMRSPILGLIVIVLLWLAIIATMLRFYRISRTSAYLLIPYILWVSFAAVLNYFIWMLNG